MNFAAMGMLEHGFTFFWGVEGEREGVFFFGF